MSKTTGILQDLEDIKARLMEISFYPSAEPIKAELQRLCSEDLSTCTHSMFDSIFSNKWRGAVRHLESIIEKSNDKTVVAELKSLQVELVDFLGILINEF